MSEKETVGMTEQVNETKKLDPAKEAKKKKAKYNLAKVIVALCVVLCIVLTVFEMGFTYRTIKAVEVDGTEYSVAEYNWLYSRSVNEVYNSYYQTYGQLASYFFNPQAPLDEQQLSEEQTWDDYIRDYTENVAIELTQLNKEGKANGFEMSEEYFAMIDSEWEALSASAALYGYSANDYAEINYGRGVNEEVFKEMYELYLYAYAYSSHLAESEVVTEADIDAYYEENKDNFDSVSYKAYFANGTAAEGEDEATAMDEASAEATEVLNGTKEVEFTESDYVVRANVNDLYADWLFDEARVAGDKEVFEAENGYYVVEFVELNDIHYNTVNVRHILVAPSDTADEAAWAEALVNAQKYEEEWKSLGGSETAFAEVAQKYSIDSSAENGGLYENIFKGQMVAEFEDWCFDSERKPGDSGIIKTTYGYHIMYFSGVAEEYYDYAIDASVRNERVNNHLDSLVEGIELTELFGNRFIGKHYN